MTKLYIYVRTDMHRNRFGCVGPGHPDLFEVQGQGDTSPPCIITFVAVAEKDWEWETKLLIKSSTVLALILVVIVFCQKIGQASNIRLA